MACGTPVVLSDISVFRELFKSAAIFCDPYDNEDIAEGIYGVISNFSKNAYLVQSGIELAKTFSWRSNSDKLLGVLNNFNK
jgi:glycosyltransferase involved in cell wall biosynthesis